MVILGGLEIVAAGLLLNEFNKDKVEARERRKHEHEHHHHDNHDDNRPGRPSHRPSHGLMPPAQPIRPLSAPPDQNGRPWPGQPGPQRPPPFPQQWQPQQPSQPFVPNMAPTPPPPYSSPIPPQGYPNFAPNNYPPHQQPGMPRPGIPHAATFNPPQQQPPTQPNFRPVQSSQTFPINPAAMSQPNLASAPIKPTPTGPLTYVDKKTGRVSHNLYPPDHPMARSVGQPDAELSPEMWVNRSRARSTAADGHSGLRYTQADEDDLAYGKDYTNGRRSRLNEW